MGTGSDPLMPRARPTGLWHDRITSPSPRSPSPPRARSTSPLTTSRRRCSGPGTPRAASWSGCSTRGWPHGFSGSRSCPCSRLPTMRCGPGSSCGSPRCSPTSLRAAAPSLTGCSRASCGGPRRPRVPGRSRTWWLLESFSSMRSNGDQATVPLEEDESGTSESTRATDPTTVRGRSWRGIHHLCPLGETFYAMKASSSSSAGPQPMEVIEISSDMERSIASGAGSWSPGPRS
ncbi:uncharacterized protein [Miscanthus floridulus]|uniref:uncharacterized protein isoform X2 n=1 Tax=Miscanthus floridulus TaxID=154761 RepID=UPI003459D1F9